MLKYIKIKNFLSFKEETEINFESSNYWSKKDNVFSIENTWWKTTLSKSMVIYGANASWKSNILRAIVVIRSFVMWQPFVVAPFLLDENSKKSESFFEICFFIGNKEYIYNFELLWWLVKSENLFEVKGNKSIILFIRNNQKIEFRNDFKQYSNQLEDKVKENISVLWVLDQFNWKLNEKPVLHFFNKLHSLWSAFDGIQTVKLLKLNENDNYKQFVIEFLKCADINICDIKIEETVWQIIDFDVNKKDVQFSQWKWLDIRFWHKVNWTDKVEYFPLWNESEWTKKLFWILGMIIITIKEEWVLFFDEIENNLHPHIVKNLLHLIHNNLWWKYQFIFTTHSLELMTLKEFKKEQIWITEKLKDNSTKFYTLYDFEDLRSENDIQKMYNLWALWWVPVIRDFTSLVKEMKLWENQKS